MLKLVIRYKLQLFNNFDLLSHSYIGFTIEIALSSYEKEVNQMLTSVYNANYPKQLSHNMQEMNLNLVFDQIYLNFQKNSLTQELV